MALAQIEIAKKTIDHSTDTALNRLKWIRRNKDKQNLTNLNINFNFTNQRLASLTEVVKASAAKKTKDKDEDVFIGVKEALRLEELRYQCFIYQKKEQML